MVASSLLRGFTVASLAVVLTGLLELASKNHVVKLYKAQPELYRTAIWVNLRNNLMFGPIVYAIAVDYFAKEPLSPLYRLRAIFGILVIEGILYYLVHRAFHEIKGLYWIHKYHHQFNTIILPSSANAVSIGEYMLAYMFPLAVALPLAGADEVSFVIAVSMVAIANLLIHTPDLEDMQVHWMFVSTSDHMNHHYKSKVSYAAPIVSFDRILERVSSSVITDKKE